MTPEQFLTGLFESNRKTANYYTKHPPYKGDSLVRAKPWWPPLCEVWAHGEQCPDSFQNPASWRAAYDLLSTLHRQYKEQKPA